MRFKKLFWSNIPVLLYTLVLIIFLYSFRIKKPPSYQISNSFIPGSCLFKEFTYYYNNKSNFSNENILEKSKWVEYKPYKRLIFIILDAFRLDYVIHDPLLSQNEPRFVYTNKMNKFNNKLQKIGNKYRLFRFKAEIPTTTIARIKSILTGHSHAYLHITDNNNPQLLETDNILKQCVLQDKKIVIMGDSLWDSLNKGMSIRSHTANGLNIHDNTADTKVFNHFFDEIKKSDWDVIIGHLVGVDHFGHVHGIENPAISNLIKSYDKFVDLIIDIILTKRYQDTLLVIFSDHGVTTQGTHGGKTPEEVDAFMTMFNYNGFADDFKPIEHILTCNETNFLQGYRQKHNVLNGKINGDIFHWSSQNDLVPTLSMLLGIPIPYHSTGRILYETLPNSPLKLLDSSIKKYSQLIPNQRYHSHLCHINLYSLIRNYYPKNQFGSSLNGRIITKNLFMLNKLYHLLLIFEDPVSITDRNAEFHHKLLKSHLKICQKLTDLVTDSPSDSDKFDYLTIAILFLLLVLSIFKMMDWTFISQILCKSRFTLFSTSLTLFLCSLFLYNEDFNIKTFNTSFNLSISIAIPVIFCILWNYLSLIRIDLSAPTLSASIKVINKFYIPEILVIAFHVTTPFLESLSVQAPSCYTSLLVYLIIHNLLTLENWTYRLNVIREANKNANPFHFLKKCIFLLKPFVICLLIKILHLGKFKYLSNFGWWCKIIHFHPLPLLSLSIIYQFLNYNTFLLDYHLKVEWIMWTVQAVLSSFHLSYNHGEMIKLCYISANIVFIISGLMILYSIIRPFKSPSPSSASYTLHTISIHLIWPAFLLYGPSQSINLIISIGIEKLFFEVVKYTLKDSNNYNISPMRFAIVYILLGEHFYYSTEHTNSFFTLPFNAAYTLTGTYIRFLSEFLICYHVFFFSVLSAIQFLLTLINYKSQLAIHNHSKNSMPIAIVINRISLGAYIYVLCSGMILTFVKSDKLYYSIFLPSTVFTVCRTATFATMAKFLFIIIDRFKMK